MVEMNACMMHGKALSDEWYFWHFFLRLQHSTTSVVALATKTIGEEAAEGHQEHTINARILIKKIIRDIHQESHVNTTLNVMVIRVNLRWTWSITADNEVVRCFSLPLVVPPVVVLGTSAAQLWHGLWYHPLTRPIMSAIAILASLSKRSMSVVVTDDASANAKLDSFWRQLCEQAGEFHCRLPCMMHQLHLASVSVVQGTDHGKSLVNTLYSASLLLRMGGNFLRLQHSTTSVVALATKTIGEPPRDAIEFAAELLDYVAVNYRSVSSRAREAGRSTEDAFTQDRMDPEADPEVEEGESGTRAGHRASLGQLWRTRLLRSESLPQLLEMWGLPDRSAKAQMLKDVVQCMEIFNGPLFPCGCNSHWHYCTGDHCCPHGPAGVQSMKNKMANSLKAVILRVVPTVPAVSRWTAVGPAVDFSCLAICSVRYWGHSANLRSSLSCPREQLFLARRQKQIGIRCVGTAAKGFSRI